jgi:hypothetical protein
MDDIKNSLDLYINHKIKPGGFLTAVLENNLIAAVGQADEQNINRLREICAYVYNKIPFESWGSKVEVANWLIGKTQ